MIKINIVCVGNLKDKPFIMLEQEYIKRLQRFAKVKVVELKERTSFSNIKETINAETEDILNNININNSILLDKEGENFSSEQFAKIIENWALDKSEITFIIGGSYGVSEEMKNSKIKKFSFGKMTFPHRMARIMLLEQVYRAFTINNNISYHK